MCEYNESGAVTKHCPCHKPESHLAVRNLRRNLASLIAAQSKQDESRIAKYTALSVEWRDRVNSINGVRAVPPAEVPLPQIRKESLKHLDPADLRRAWAEHHRSPHVQRHIEDALWNDTEAAVATDIDADPLDREPLTNPSLLRPGLTDEQLLRRNFERMVFTRALKAEADCHSVMWNDTTLAAMDAAYTRDPNTPGVPEANLNRQLTDQTLLDRHGSNVFKHWVRAHGGVITYPQYRHAAAAQLTAV